MTQRGKENGEIRQRCREHLEKLKVGQELRFPVRHKDMMYQERVDLQLFHGYDFRGRTDKANNRMIVRRVG